MIVDLRSKWKYWGFIFLFTTIFTSINNYYFYTHVKHSAEKDVKQLQLILEKDLKYFREQPISAKKYRGHVTVIVQQFHKKAHYNKKIHLEYANAFTKTGKIRKGYESWTSPDNSYDKVIQSTINIVIPELKSKTPLDYQGKVLFSISNLGWSVLRSMTLSTQDTIPLILSEGFSKAWNEFWYHYRYRSHVPVVVFLTLLFLFSRIRKYQIELEETKNKEIQKKDKTIKEQSKILKEPHIYQNKSVGKIIDLLRSKKYEEIEKLTIDINSKNNDNMTALMLYALEDTTEEDKLKAIETLVKNGARIDIKNKEGMTALMLYAIGNTKNDEKSQVIDRLIEYGAKINEKNHSGFTALMLCSNQDISVSTQKLLENGADSSIVVEAKASTIATGESKKILTKIINSDPQKPVKLLKNFTTKESPLKWTAHTWDFNGLPEKPNNQKYNNFDEYLNDVKIQIENMREELKELSPNLYTKIYTFCVEKNPIKNYSWCKDSHINIGWSSLKELAQWCNNGNKAHLFPLEDKSFFYKGKDITTFGEVMNIFKQEIEIRRDFKNLEIIFENIEDNLPLSFTLKTQKLEKQFYTDTEKLHNALNNMFEEIKKRKNFPIIEVFTDETNDKSIELKIIHIDSYSNTDPKTLFDRINNGNGNFGKLKEDLTNLCDWSIEFTYKNTGYRLNCLKSNNVNDIIELTYLPKGFTHILRFY